MTTTAILIRDTLHRMAAQTVPETLAGKYRLHVIADDARTVGLAALFVPVHEIEAVTEFVIARCGGKPPEYASVVRLNPEGN